MSTSEEKEKMSNIVNSQNKEKPSKLEHEESSDEEECKKKLEKLQKQKIELEIAMETEQEFIVNQMTKQISEKKRNSSTASATPSASISNLSLNSPHPAKEVDEELKGLREKIAQMEIQHAERLDQYEKEIERLKGELSVLHHQTNKE